MICPGVLMAVFNESFLSRPKVLIKGLCVGPTPGPERLIDLTSEHRFPVWRRIFSEQIACLLELGNRHRVEAFVQQLRHDVIVFNRINGTRLFLFMIMVLVTTNMGFMASEFPGDSSSRL